MRESRRRRSSCGLLALLVATGGVGCQSDPPRATSSSGAVVTKNSAPLGTPMARVSLGMTKAQVANAIGDATESRSHFMAQNFNPLYWGSDRYRTIWYYAAQGRLTFNMGAKLILIEYDPGEPGHAPPK